VKQVGRGGGPWWRAIFAALVASWSSIACAVVAVPVASGFEAPTDVVAAHDGSGRLFVAEQGGRIWVVAGGVRRTTPFADLGALTSASGERGLLGVAFHPDYRSNGRLYVDYTRRSDGATVIAELRVGADPDHVDLATHRVLMLIPQPFDNHNGGALRFGPDRLLYIGMGDGGSGGDPGNRAQDPRQLLGKILRIDVDGGVPYGIPPGNPFADGIAGRAEIFATGLRNPWRLSFDRATGDLYIADVGQNDWEEVDRLPAGTGAGANLGWRTMEGTHCTGLPSTVSCNAPSLVLPIIEYSHAQGCSITGGFVYRGTAVPALAGRYVYSDYCAGFVRSAAVVPGSRPSSRTLTAAGVNISTFGEDEAGEVYIADQANGTLSRLTAESGDVVDAIEYYDAALDHYFITSLPAEIHALDGNVQRAWRRTGEAFGAYAAARPGFLPVCRFYIPPGLGDSHFLSASDTECAEVRRRFPGFIEEHPTGLVVALPDLATGACPVGTTPVYRVWNGRADANHRYVTDPDLRNTMVSRGGIPEGYGTYGVGFCAVS
jgi:glucose/arabinose dehydrogenase